MNKTIAAQLTHAQNQCDEAQLRKLLSPDFKSHISDVAQPMTRDQYIEGVKMAHQAFSDLIFTIKDTICENDKVVLRIIARGRHTGEYMGIAPTQNLVEFAGITIRRIRDGQVIEEWQTNDQLSLLRQISH